MATFKLLRRVDMPSDAMLQREFERAKLSNFNIRENEGKGMAGLPSNTRKLMNKFDFVATEGRRDPKKCWYFESLIDYDEYMRLRDGTGLRDGPAWKVKRKRSKGKVAESKDPAASEVEKKRKRGEEVESTNPAASKVESMGKQKQKEVKSKNPAALKVESMGKQKQKEVESKNPAASKVERKRNRKHKEGGSKNPAASKGERKRKRKGKEAESENPAGNTNNVNNNHVIDVEDDSDNVNLGEFLRKQRTLKALKNKKQTASEVEEPGLVPTVREPEMTAKEKCLKALEEAMAETWDPRTTPYYFYESPADFSWEKAKKYMRKVTD